MPNLCLFTDLFTPGCTSLVIIPGQRTRRGKRKAGEGEIIISTPRPSGSVVLPAFLVSDPLPTHASAPFVTRERELAELATALAAARAGQGQALFVIGSAGRGKTMLMQEFARQAQAVNAELLVLSGYCNAHTGGGDPYLPFREALTLLTGDVAAKWAGGLISQAHAQRLWEAMPLTLPALVEHAPDLINSFVPDQALLERAATFAPPEVAWLSRLRSLAATKSGAGLEQKRIFAQYTALLKAIAGQRSLLLIIEDLHWVDASSSDLLFHLSREVGDNRILLVGTYRPEEVAFSLPTSEGGPGHPLAGIVSELKRRYGDIWLDLGRMAPMEGRRFIEAYLDTQPNRLGGAFRERLFQHTGGHALFTVELLREMQDRGDLRQDEAGRWVAGETIDWHRLPARVEGVIERRINRLEEELQAVLTIASVEGETFTAEVVARVQQLNERSLVQRLSRELDKQHRLVTAQALERLGQQRLSLYRFRHQLFQHYLYQRLDEMERAYLHEEVGTVLEALYGEQTEQVAVQLARHFEMAGLTDKAIDYLLLAGKRASQVSANEEAMAHLTRGLELLLTQPVTSERDQKELTLQLALGVPVTATKGYGSSEVERIYLRARELGQQLSETAQLFQALYGLNRCYGLQGQLQKAREVGEELLQLAQAMQEPGLLLEAHRALGANLFHLGELVSAQTHFEYVIAWYDAQRHQAHAFLYGHDPAMTCLTYAALNVWLLGYPDQSLARNREVLQLAQEKLSHPFSLAYALAMGAWPLKFRREARATQERAEAAINLSTERGFPLLLALGTILRGWALVEQGEGEIGVAQVRQGRDGWQATGAKLLWPPILALLAEAYGKAGQTEEALATVAEAVSAAKKEGECWWDAELSRLKGELLLNASPENRGTDSQMDEDEVRVEAEACFQRAIEIARQQSARSLELRATISLSRWWHSLGLLGKSIEAYQILAGIYHWFTEGFDTPDLMEAKALLEALAQSGIDL